MNFDLLNGHWLRYEGTYYYCRGTTPEGQPRLIQMARPPYGKSVFVHDAAADTWSAERLPTRLRPGAAVALLLAVAMLILVPLILSGQDPILWKFSTPVAVGFFLLAALVTQFSHLRPHDAISQAEANQEAFENYAQAQQEAAERRAYQQARASANAQQGQMAIWAQLAQINQAMHPGQDTYRPYGQSPPL
ncbi:hypothetical protein [Streptomyces sp. NPDC088727]|uniref:hypothetical protein n=1 Tax=Streptomyces sp. NPDC088727 TaxID=3365875 RepID=UPI00382B4BA7